MALDRGEDTAAIECLAEAEEIGRTGTVPLSYVCTVVRILGESLNATGDHDAAIAHLERSLTIARSVGDSWGEARSLAVLADVGTDVGAARANARRAIEIQERLGDELGLARTRWIMRRLDPSTYPR